MISTNLLIKPNIKACIAVVELPANASVEISGIAFIDQ